MRNFGKILFSFLVIMIFSYSTNIKGEYQKLAYDFKFKDLDGSELNLNEFKNKVIVVVNVASQCGFTNQYNDMQKIKIDARPTTKIDQKIYDLLSNEFEEYKSEKNVLDKINIQKRKEIEAKELLNQEIEVVKDTEVKKDKAEPLSEIKKENREMKKTDVMNLKS